VRAMSERNPLFRSFMICGGICAGPRETSRMSGIDNANGPQASTARLAFSTRYSNRRPPLSAFHEVL
jgi:hypothetical protein